MPNIIVALPSTPAGSSLPVQRAVVIANQGSGTIDYNITSNAGWLASSVETGSITNTGTQTITISADINGLTANAYVGNIILQPINGTCASNGPFDIEVQLTVT